MHYIIPLRRNTTEVQIPENTSLYPHAFNFHQRNVFWTSGIKDGYKVVVYYDMLLAMHETNDLICRLEKKNNTMAVMREKEDAFEGWLFVNHLAFMLYGILDYVAQANLAAKYSFKDVVRILKGIRANKINGQWRLTQFTKNIRKLCTDLNIKIDGPLVG